MEAVETVDLTDDDNTVDLTGDDIDNAKTIDLTLDDSLADDEEAAQPSRQPQSPLDVLSSRLYVYIDKDGYVSVNKCCPGASGDNIVYLRRLHSVHPSNKDFKRMIAFLYDASNSPHRLSLLVYRIPPGFSPSVKQHGNSKSETPFHPTWASTKQCIKQECLVQGPKAIVSSISAKFGGIIGATGPGELPRNETQISNFKKKISFESRSSNIQSIPHNSAVDDLFTVMQQAYSDDPLHRFVRAVNAAPEPAVVVATNSQLQNLARFCTSSFEFSVMTVDPTFSLGEFNVTLTTFRHLFLQLKRYKQPSVFVGPACIHFKKTFSTYLFFASTLIGQCRELESVRVLGTDGELALVDAFKHEFGYAQHLTCFIHVQRNIKFKLQECNIPSNISIEILNDILGIKVGTTYVEGLVDAHNRNDFDTKIEKLVAKWQNSELTSTSQMDHFIDWFKSHKAPVIRSSMIRDVREESGLGSPPIPFTTNAANYMLKNKVNYKKNELPEFLEKNRELVNDQEHQVENTVIGKGNYELCSQYKLWHVTETKWFTMTAAQRGEHLKKFAQASLCDTSTAGGDIVQSDIATITLGRDVSLSTVLSVSLDSFSNDVRIPRNCLEGIWNKASEILKTSDSIVTAPGVTNAKFVLSYSGSKPHLVVPRKGSVFACDSDCPNWKGLGKCSHSVAVAEMCNKLPEYVEKYKKSKKVLCSA